MIYITLDKNTTKEKFQKLFSLLMDKIESNQKSKKQKIIEDTFGKISFEESKSPVIIQNEMRDEWD